MAETRSESNPIDELAEEFAHRLRAGERPSVGEFAERYPQWAEEIHDVLSAVAMVERLKPRREDARSDTPPGPTPGGPPDRVGEFRIVREIGRGGMGVVYEADQETLGRRVAVKILPGHLLGDETSRSRFRREAQAAARLHHTNVVPVFGVGEAEGRCFYVMQLINGRGLDGIIRDAARAAGPGGVAPATLSGLGPRAFCREIARLGAQVADALAYAHLQGVLHRDVKPSNLLLDDGGKVWVTDFGVAKQVEDARLTQSGDMVGTLKYMPPERFDGHSDARGDVYSLGVTLYELLTLRPAFPDTTPQHLIRLITQGSLPGLRSVNPAVPPELEKVVQKASARDPSQRYQTAGELAEDLRRFLSDRPVLARRTGMPRRAWRWCRRNPALAAVTAAALLLMVAVTVVSAVGYARTAAANRETVKALGAETAQRENAERTAALALGALNRTYDRFAPARLVATPQANEAGVELPPQPALPPEAVPLLEDLLRTYEQVATSSLEFPSLHAQAAEANHRIGDLHQRLGRFASAAAAYRGAIELYAGLPASASDTTRVQWARGYNDLGHSLRALHQFDEAAQMHTQAIRILEESPETLTCRAECRYERARSYLALGQRDMFLSAPGPRPGGPGPESRFHHRRPPPEGPGDGRPERPRDRPPAGRGAPQEDDFCRRAADLLEALVSEFPAVPEYRHLLACCYRDMPPGRSGRDRRQPGPPSERGVELLRQLVKEFPRIPDYRLDLCETLGGGGPSGRGHDARTIERLKEAIDLSKGLVEQYPNVPEFAAAHARYLDRLGMKWFRLGKVADAERLHRDAVTGQRKLVKQYPEVFAYRIWLSLMERSLGQVVGGRGEVKEATALLRGAVKQAEAALKRAPHLAGLRPFLGMAYRDLAQALERGGEPALAAEALRKAKQFGDRRSAVSGPHGQGRGRP